MYRYLIILVILILASCDKEVVYDPQDHDPYIVVNAIVSTDSTWNIQLQYSKAIYEKGDFDPVLGADVEIRVLQDEEDGQEEIQKFSLDGNGDGTYSRGSFPNEGRYYELSIIKDDHELWAKTYVPKVLDAEIIEQRQIRIEEDGESETVEFDVRLNTEDNQTIYYAWDVIPLEEEDNKEDQDDHDISEMSDHSDPDQENTNPKQKGPAAYLTRNPGIGAVPFTNESGEFTLGGNSVGGSKLTNLIKQTYNNGTVTETPEFQFKIRVWAISYEYYRYLISIQQQTTASSDVDFVNPYSNVTNGGGIFAGYTLKELYPE